MALPERQAFAPFVVVVGSKYFFPVPECLLNRLDFIEQSYIFCCTSRKFFKLKKP